MDSLTNRSRSFKRRLTLAAIVLVATVSAEEPAAAVDRYSLTDLVALYPCFVSGEAHISKYHVDADMFWSVAT